MPAATQDAQAVAGSNAIFPIPCILTGQDCVPNGPRCDCVNSESTARLVRRAIEVAILSVFLSSFPDRLATAGHLRGVSSAPIIGSLGSSSGLGRPASRCTRRLRRVVISEPHGRFGVCVQPGARKVTGRLASRPPGRLRRAVRFRRRPVPQPQSV